MSNEIENKDLLNVLTEMKDNHLRHIEKHTENTLKETGSTNKLLIGVIITLVVVPLFTAWMGM